MTHDMFSTDLVNVMYCTVFAPTEARIHIVMKMINTFVHILQYWHLTYVNNFKLKTNNNDILAQIIQHTISSVQ